MGPRFEDLTIELQQVVSPPGLETAIFSAPFLASEGSLWIGALNTWNDESLHQVQRRMILGDDARGVSNHDERSDIRRFPVGAVLIVEDTSGAGH